MKHRQSWGFKLRALIITAAIAITFSACGSTGTGEIYYVSLGDSLSVGVQPDANGMNMETDEGYADQLYQRLLVNNPNLVLVKFGCPGETTVTMLEGGICDYAEGSQIDEAVKFIEDNIGSIFLITINIGVNDIFDSGCTDNINPMDPDATIACITPVFQAIGSNLSLILSTLFSSVQGTDIPVVGMNYYNSFLAAFVTGPAGQGLAVISDVLAQTFNFMVLQPVYDLMGFPVANVFSAFMSSDFMTPSMAPNPAPPPQFLPINVATLCFLTWNCTPPPMGPNIHANADGYALIADVFAQLLVGLGIQ